MEKYNEKKLLLSIALLVLGLVVDVNYINVKVHEKLLTARK